MNLPTDPAVLAYAAAFLDGEGCIGISYPKSAHGRRYHRLDVRIANSDMRAMVWMRDNFGGRIQEHSKNKMLPKGHRRMYQWHIGSAMAGEFLAAIRPYMVIKGEQADIAMAFRATTKGRVGNTRRRGTRLGEAFETANPVTQMVDAEREEMRQRIMALNSGVH